MYIIERFKRSLIALIIICVIAGFGFIHKSVTHTSTSPVLFKTVIIDPGHGGFDGGASASDGTAEKDINLKISIRMRDILKFYGYNVVMTRTEDTGTEDDSNQSISTRKKSDLKNRLSLMQNDGDTIYVSVHLNKFTTSAASGAQVFYTPNFDEAQTLGDCIQKSIVNLLQPENKRVVKKGGGTTYILKNAKVPAVIVECGFLSNKGDLNNLKDEEYQNNMAFSISAGIIEYYKITG